MQTVERRVCLQKYPDGCVFPVARFQSVEGFAFLVESCVDSAYNIRCHISRLREFLQLV